MSNWLFVRRVKVQEIDHDGKPLGEPDYGVLASDDYEQGFHVGFRSLDELNAAAREAGSLLDIVGGFDEADRDQIGYENYEGGFPDANEKKE